MARDARRSWTRSLPERLGPQERGHFAETSPVTGVVLVISGAESRDRRSMVGEVRRLRQVTVPIETSLTIGRSRGPIERGPPGERRVAGTVITSDPEDLRSLATHIRPTFVVVAVG